MTGDPRDPETPRLKHITLRLKVHLRTDEAYLIDLGQGKVWIPVSAIRATRRVSHGIFEIEVRQDVIEAKRKEMCKHKEKATGIKGSILGEVLEIRARLVKERKDSVLIEYRGQTIAIPWVCLAEWEKTGDGECRLVAQMDYMAYALGGGPTDRETHFTVEVGLVRETDRACLFSYQGKEFWYPKREVIGIKPLEGDLREILVPASFWRFKLGNLGQ